MIEDYRPVIGATWLIKQEMMEADVKHLWPYHLPAIAATEPEILDAEKYLGHPLDPRYKAFLLCANGWPAFYQTVDLFGSKDLICGEKHETGQFVFSCLEDEVLKNSNLVRGDLLPIAATSRDRDLFLLGRDNSAVAGNVFWFAGTEIDRWPNFDEYFLSMVEYNKQELHDLKSGK